jgi:small subunit ribosomal protein S8
MTLADMLTRIRNAVQARHAKVDMPTSRLRLNCRILKDEDTFLISRRPKKASGPTLFLKYGEGRESHYQYCKVSRQVAAYM